MKKDPTQKALDKLREHSPYSDEGRGALKKGLLHRTNLVVAKAAEIVADSRLEELQGELEEALLDWLQKPAKLDSGARAKTALVRAACEMELTLESCFSVGVRVVQLEAGYGGAEDVAAELRGLCAVGLVRCYSPDVLDTLADLLADTQATARVWAARALLEKDGEGAAALLRLRLRAGEEEPAVVLECLTGLLVLNEARGLELLQELYLQSARNPFWPVAILALGESRQAQACEVLKELYAEAVGRSERQQILEALALSRREEALEFLRQKHGETELQEREFISDLAKRFWGEAVAFDET